MSTLTQEQENWVKQNCHGIDGGGMYQMSETNLAALFALATSGAICELCGNTGHYPVGNSGSDADGNGYIFEDCECDYSLGIRMEQMRSSSYEVLNSDQAEIIKTQQKEITALKLQLSQRQERLLEHIGYLKELAHPENSNAAQMHYDLIVKWLKSDG
jgi:hypothetical protein